LADRTRQKKILK
jgi:hypothetical protein